MSIPLIGETTIKVNLGKTLHHVPNEIVMAGLADDFRDVLEPGWYACVLLSDGRGALSGATPFTARPGDDVCERMMEVAGLLNREHHNGGHWITAWSGGIMHILFRDGDGDLQFCMEIDEPWVRVAPWPATEIASRAALAAAATREETRRMDARKGETYRRALGERAPSSVH